MKKIEAGTPPYMSRIKEAFHFLSETSTNGFGEVVEKTRFHLKCSNLVFRFNDPQFPLVPPGFITDYENILPNATEEAPAIRAIIIDNSRIMRTTKQELASDLGRTLFVADQDLEKNGIRYQRGYREIYTEALNNEDEWRRGSNLGGNETDFRRRLKRVLGEARYFSDISFYQWQRLIDEHAVFASNGERDKLMGLREIPDDFIVRRSNMLRTLHAQAKDSIGNGYLTKYSQQDRARIIGNGMIQAITGQNEAGSNMLQ